MESNVRNDEKTETPRSAKYSDNNWRVSLRLETANGNRYNIIFDAVVFVPFGILAMSDV